MFLGYNYRIMNHRGIMLVLLAGSFFWGRDASQQEKTSPSASADHADQTQNVVPPPSTVVDPPATTPPNQTVPAPEQHASQPDTLCWFLRPEWVIVWVTLIYTVLTGFTLLAIKRQADLMAGALKDARKESEANAISTAATLKVISRQADTMAIQIKMMKEQGRARLDLDVGRTLKVEVDGEDLTQVLATLSVRNIGASRAFVKRTSVALTTKLRDEELPRGYADYSPLELPEQFVDPDKPADSIGVILFPSVFTTTETFANDLEHGDFSLHLLGLIEYETLGFRWTKPFGYDWKIVDRRSVRASLHKLSDPYPNTPRPARDRIVYGFWEPNEERNIPEYPTPDDEGKPQNPN